MGAFSGPFICSCFCSECGRWRTFAGFANALPSQEPVGNLPVDAEGADWGAASGRLAALRRMPRPVLCEALFSRSLFDSSQARQTVRWGRFRGLEFALENAAATELNAAGFATAGRRCGVGAWALVFWCGCGGAEAAALKRRRGRLVQLFVHRRGAWNMARPWERNRLWFGPFRALPILCRAQGGFVLCRLL